MPARPVIVRWLAQADFVIFCVAVFVALTFRVLTIGQLDIGIGDHWPAHHHDLTIVDRTEDPGWHQAIEEAKSTWDMAGDDLRLSVTTGRGPCRAGPRDHIEVCQQPLSLIAQHGLPGEEGLFQPQVAGGHEYRSTVILVCSDCVPDQERRVVIATHEIGHALGLAHNLDPLSVMYPSGGSTRPDDQDYRILRTLEGQPGSAGQASHR